MPSRVEQPPPVIVDDVCALAAHEHPRVAAREEAVELRKMRARMPHTRPQRRLDLVQLPLDGLRHRAPR